MENKCGQKVTLSELETLFKDSDPAMLEKLHKFIEK